MLERFIKKNLLDHMKIMPVVLLAGARQTGKTTLMESIIEQDGYFYCSAALL